MNSWLYVSLRNEKINEIECSTENLNIYKKEIQEIPKEIQEIPKEIQEIPEEPKEIQEIPEEPKEIQEIPKLNGKSIYISNFEIMYEQITNIGLCYDYLNFENKICIIGIFALLCTTSFT